jgi:hypothetical protein
MDGYWWDALVREVHEWVVYGVSGIQMGISSWIWIWQEYGAFNVVFV